MDETKVYRGIIERTKRLKYGIVVEFISGRSAFIRCPAIEAVKENKIIRIKFKKEVTTSGLPVIDTFEVME